MKLLHTAILAAALSLSLSAQVNSPTANGLTLRGIAMLRSDFTNMAIDQLALAEQANPTPAEAEAAAWAKAVATLRSGAIDQARTLLRDYIDRWPAAAATVNARIALADCDFFQANYRKAADGYAAIDPAAPDLATADHLAYRQAFCYMMLGDDDRALASFSRLTASPTYSSAARFYQGYIYYTHSDFTTSRKLLENVDQLTPPGNQAPYLLAQIDFSQERYDDALATARAALAQSADSPYAPEMMRIAGESLYHLGDTPQAVGYLESYLAATTGHAEPSALYIVGSDAYERGDLVRAIGLLTPVADQPSALGQSAYLYIGQAYLQQGNMDAAAVALEKAYRLDYDQSIRETAFYNYAITRLEGGSTPFGSTTALMEDFLRNFPDSRYAPQVEEYLVAGYMTDNNYEQALASINASHRQSAALLAAKQRVLYTLGTRDLAANRTDQALARLRESKSLADKADKAMGAEADLWIGDCLYRQGQYDDAAKAFTSYLRTAPATSPNRTVATYDLAYTRFAQRRYDDALSGFAKVAAATGSDAPDARTLADCYCRMGDCKYYASAFAAAADYYDRALAANTATGDYPLFQKAIMRGLARQHSDKVDMLNQMMRDYPSSALLPSALLEKAESQLAMGHADDALTTYSQLTARYPATAQGRNGYLQMAITQMQLGQSQQAIATYKQVIANYPTSEEAKVAADDLMRILADEGRLTEYSAFIATVPTAPRLQTEEADRLTFQAAEKKYLANSGDTRRLEAYVAEYPTGQYAPQALSYLATAAFESGDLTAALSYATTLVDSFPHAQAAEEALAIKAEILLDNGDTEEALAAFGDLEARASTTRNVVAARMGIVRASADLGRHADVVAAADALMAASSLDPGLRSEVAYKRAAALAELGHADQAASEWQKLAADPSDLYGAMAAYRLAAQQYADGNLKQSRRTVKALIDSNTPHQYWLALGYILLSDIMRSEGNAFEANEYLKSLRENYPGTEPDIFDMIDSRLAAAEQ